MYVWGQGIHGEGKASWTPCSQVIAEVTVCVYEHHELCVHLTAPSLASYPAPFPLQSSCAHAFRLSCLLAATLKYITQALWYPRQHVQYMIKSMRPIQYKARQHNTTTWACTTRWLQCYVCIHFEYFDLLIYILCCVCLTMYVYTHVRVCMCLLCLHLSQNLGPVSAQLCWGQRACSPVWCPLIGSWRERGGDKGSGRARREERRKGRGEERERRGREREGSWWQTHQHIVYNTHFCLSTPPFFQRKGERGRMNG